MTKTWKRSSSRKRNICRSVCYIMINVSNKCESSLVQESFYLAVIDLIISFYFNFILKNLLKSLMLIYNEWLCVEKKETHSDDDMKQRVLSLSILFAYPYELWNDDSFWFQFNMKGKNTRFIVHNTSVHVFESFILWKIYFYHLCHVCFCWHFQNLNNSFIIYCWRMS